MTGYEGNKLGATIKTGKTGGGSRKREIYIRCPGKASMNLNSRMQLVA